MAAFFWYGGTPEAQLQAAGGGATVTPGTLTLVLSTFAPVVTVSDHKTVTPAIATLSVTTFAPTVTVGVRVIPGTASLITSLFAPTVSVSDHKTVTPGTTSLVLTTFAPTVTGGSGLTVIPGTAALVTSTFAPTVTASDNKIVTPGTLALVLSMFAPIITVSDSVLGSSRSHKQEKQRYIDWSIPFSIQKENLKTLEEKIEIVKKEISEEKKDLDDSSSVYAINAISTRIDNLLSTLEILLREKETLRIQLEAKPQAIYKVDPMIAIRKAAEEKVEKALIRKNAELQVKQALLNKEKVGKFLAVLDTMEFLDSIVSEEEYEEILIKKKIRRKLH